MGGNLVYPWDLGKFKAPNDVRAKIWGDLYGQNSRCLMYRETKPDDRVLTIVEDVYAKVSEGKWVIIVSDSVKTLKVVSETFPLVYSFTSIKFSISVTTETIVAILSGSDLVQSYNSNGLFGKEKLRLYPLMLWDGILLEHRWGKNYQGDIANLLSERVRLDRSFVATVHTGDTFGSGLIDSFFNNVVRVWGEQVKNILREMVVFMEYRIRSTDNIDYFRREL